MQRSAAHRLRRYGIESGRMGIVLMATCSVHAVRISIEFGLEARHLSVTSTWYWDQMPTLQFVHHCTSAASSKTHSRYPECQEQAQLMIGINDDGR